MCPSVGAHTVVSASLESPAVIKKICPSIKRTDRLAICGTTLLGLHKMQTRSFRDANTSPAVNAGFASRVLGRRPFTLPSTVHLPRCISAGSQLIPLSVGAFCGLISVSVVSKYSLQYNIAFTIQIDKWGSNKIFFDLIIDEYVGEIGENLPDCFKNILIILFCYGIISHVAENAVGQHRSDFAQCGGIAQLGAQAKRSRTPRFLKTEYRSNLLTSSSPHLGV